MKVQFDTESVAQYEFAHGRKPRGDGGWIFDVTWCDGRGAYTSETFSTSGTYTEAKADAMNFARHAAPSRATSADVSVCS